MEILLRIVNLSNLVIDNFGGRDTTPDSADGRRSLGQALTTRVIIFLPNTTVSK